MRDAASARREAVLTYIRTLLRSRLVFRLGDRRQRSPRDLHKPTYHRNNAQRMNMNSGANIIIVVYLSSDSFAFKVCE